MTESLRVVVMDDYQQLIKTSADWSLLGPDCSITFLAEHLQGPTLLNALVDADVIVAVRERTALRAELLSRLPRLRLIVTAGMANASIDVAAARHRGIEVCGTRGIAGSTAELTWGLILAALRHIPAEDQAMRRGSWQTTIGADLEGGTLGVIGLGRLGSRVAAIGLAFGMEVLGWSTNLDPQRARDLGVDPVPKQELLRRSDIVSLHLKLSERSRGTLGAAELSIMKPTAWLINTSRGPLVDESELLDALQQRRIAGAALDVFDHEPLPADHRLRSMPNTILTPHLGYVTAATYRRFFTDAVEDILAWRTGEPIRVLD